MSLQIKDEFEQSLENKKLELKSCQESKALNSCFSCEQIFECLLRTEYVKAVYNSMSKGRNDGGFDF